MHRAATMSQTLYTSPHLFTALKGHVLLPLDSWGNQGLKRLSYTVYYQSEFCRETEPIQYIQKEIKNIEVDMQIYIYTQKWISIEREIQIRSQEGGYVHMFSSITKHTTQSLYVVESIKCCTTKKEAKTKIQLNLKKEMYTFIFITSWMSGQLEIYQKELAHAIMEADKAQDLNPGGRKASGVCPSSPNLKVREPGEPLQFHSRGWQP